MSNSHSYYGAHPLAEAAPTLDRPLVLSGAPGVGVGLVGATLCSLTGWPFVEIERAVEHDAGHSIARLTVQEGIAMVSARCWAHVARTLGRSPTSVIAVPAMVLAASPRLAHVLERATVHHLTASIPDQVEWLQQRSERDPGHLGWFLSGTAATTAVETLHQSCLPVAQRATACHTVRPSAHLRTARTLMALLTG